MSADTENKPFRCNFPGCHQKFTNVDRLNVHQEAHKQGGNLKLKMGLVNKDHLVDQTPTPTRFLKDCDEEGVFQELNPLDEQIREARLSNIASQKEGGTEDNMDTLAAVATAVSANTSPTHSVAELFANSSAAQLAAPAPNDNRPVTSSPFFPPGVVVPVPPPASVANPEASIPMAIAPMNLLPKSQSPASTASAKPGTVAANTKKRLQEAISRQHGAANKEAVPSPLFLSQGGLSRPAAQLQNTPKLLPKVAENNIPQAPPLATIPTNSSGTITLTPTKAVDSSPDSAEMSPSSPPELVSKPGKRKRTPEDLDPTEKRARFLQRNREAATRCREKRKHWIQTLEKRSNELARQNAQLQSEVMTLRNERAHLKLLLLSHKDCPVTIQQQKQLAPTGATTGASTSTTPTLPSVSTIASTASSTTAAAPVSIGSPITPLVMFPLTPDGLQVAAAAAAATPAIDINTLNFLHQFQQQQSQSQVQQVVTSQGSPTIPATPSAQQVQALLSTAHQLALLQAIQHQQATQAHHIVQDTRSEGTPTPSDASIEANASENDITVVEISVNQ